MLMNGRSCLCVEECQQFSACASGRESLDFAVEHEVFIREYAEHVFDEPAVKRAVRGAGGDDLAKVDEQDLCRLRRDDAHGKSLYSGAGEDFAEEIAFLQFRQNRAVAEDVLPHDLYASAAHDPHPGDRVAGQEDELLSCIGHDPRSHTIEQVGELGALDAVEETYVFGYFREIENFAHTPCLL